MQLVLLTLAIEDWRVVHKMWNDGRRQILSEIRHQVRVHRGLSNLRSLPSVQQRPYFLLASSLLLLRAAILWGIVLPAFSQTLGQLRLVDFSPRTDATVVSNSNGTLTVTPGSLTPVTGDCVYIFPPYSLAQDKTLAAVHGNLGRGYFCLSVTDSTHWVITKEMYSNVASTGNGTTAGDKIVPLHTYFLRSGPRVALDGPIDKGTWSGATAYRALEMVQAPDTNYYVAVQDNTNHQPPNTTYWRQVDHSRVGPGTYTASLRNAARTSSFSYAEVKSLGDQYWGISSRYDYDKGIDEGYGAGLAAWYWLSSGDNSYLPKAQTLATQAEDLAMGTVGCNVNDPSKWCGRGSDIDYARIFTGQAAWAESVIDWTLTDAQRQGYANRMINGPDTSHNGPDTSACTPMPEIQAGTDATSQISCGTTPYVCTATGGGLNFTTMPNFGPGSVIVGIPYTTSADHSGGLQEALGRVKSVDSATQFTVEYASAQYSRMAYPKASGATHYPVIIGYNTGTTLNTLAGANAPWFYTPPWDDAQHYCGVRWYTEHHGSGPSEIPGQESHYPADYGFGGSDFSRINNRTITALPLQVAVGLQTADFDIRGVNMAEQSINYYMTQWMAQNVKSRWAAWGGHGNQYGPGRVWWFIAEIALMLKNSLTVTPPGVLTGNYLTNLARAQMYGAWNSYPQATHSEETGYTWAFNSDLAGGMQAAIMGQHTMMSAMLWPNDESSPWVWDYWKNRRGDYGCLSGCGAGGWISFNWQPWGLSLFDPTATQTSVTTNETQQGLYKSDVDECIAAGLYCLPDAPHATVFSSSDWSNTSTQVQVQAESSYIMGDDLENYSPAGAITILQNQPDKNANVLLGGVGLYPMTALSGEGGQYDASVPMIYDATTGKKDQINGYSTGNYMNVNIDRWAGQPQDGPANSAYMYTRVNYAPQVRQASDNYTTPIPTSWFAVPGNVTREVLHLKAGANNPNYLVVYDSFQGVQAGNQLRAYWHLIDMANLATGFAAGRHPEWVTTDYTHKAVTLTTPNTGRLNIKALAVPGSNNTTVAMMDEAYKPPFFSGFLKQDYAISTTTLPSWAAGTATIVIAGQPWNNFPLPVGTQIQVRGINSAGPGSFNGTFAITGYTAGATPTITYALASDPGAYTGRVAETNVSFDAWCDWASTWTQTPSCAGNYDRPTTTAFNNSYMKNGGMVWPGTYRVTTCASTDGTNCDDEQNGEIVDVLQPSPSATATMPTIAQPTCSATGGNCFTVEIQDPTAPAVAMMARNGGLVTAMSTATTHTGTADYVATGLAAGSYNVTRNGTTIASGTVTAADTTLQFASTSGTLTITQTGAPNGFLVLSPSTPLNFTCTSGNIASGPQNVSVSATGVTLDNWSASKTQSWLSISPTGGAAAGTMTVSISACPGTAGTYTDTITVASTTSGVGNSPQTISVVLTQYSSVAVSTTSPITPDGSVGTPFSFGLTASGGLAPYTWSISSGTVCNGLSLAANGTISGTPTTAQTCTVVYQVSDSQSVPSTATKSIALTIDSSTPTITLNASPGALTFNCNGGRIPTSDNPQTVTFTSSGGTLTNWTAFFHVPWLSVSPGNGTAAANFQATAFCAGLGYGTFTDTIVITSSTPGVTGPLNIPVSITVNVIPAPVTPAGRGVSVGRH